MRIARWPVMQAACVAAMLLVAPSAAAASGSLEFGKCEKVAEGTGRFANSACTKPGGRKVFNWVPLSEPAAIAIVKTPKTGVLVLQGSDGVEMTCVGEASSSGSASSAGLSNVVLRASGCEAKGAGCNSAGQEARAVASMSLHAAPGIVQKNAEGKEEADLVGLDFRGESSEFAEFACVVPFVVRGGLIARFPVNKSASSFKYAFVQELGKQIPEAFAEGPAEFLEWSVAGSSYEHAGLSLMATLKTVSKAKIELRHCEANVC